MATSNDIRLDFHVIYNDDEELSCRFTHFLVRKLEGWNLRGFYMGRDAVPGSSIVDIFSENLENSIKSLVVITPGFLRNSWSTFQQQCAIKFRVDNDDSDGIVPIALDIQPDQLPRELNIQNVIYFSKTSYEYKESQKEWDKLRMAFDKYYRAENSVQSMPHAQERKDMSAAENTTSLPESKRGFQLNVTSSVSLEFHNQSSSLSSGNTSYTSPVIEEVSKMGTETDKFALDCHTVAARCRQHLRSFLAIINDVFLGRNRGAQAERRASSTSMFGFGRGQRDQNHGWFNYTMRILSRPELAFY